MMFEIAINEVGIQTRHAATLLTFFLLSAAAPIARTDLVGTWRLVSASSEGPAGKNDAPYGSDPSGLLIYTAAGEVAVMVSHGGRRSLSVADRVGAPTEERADAYATFFAYSGRYTLSGNKITHHVQIASVPNWVGVDQVRLVERRGDRIALTTPPVRRGGRVESFKLVWERVR